MYHKEYININQMTNIGYTNREMIHFIWNYYIEQVSSHFLPLNIKKVAIEEVQTASSSPDQQGIKDCLKCRILL